MNDSGASAAVLEGKAMEPFGCRGSRLRIRVIPPKFSHERLFIGELSRTAEDIGHTVTWSNPDLVLQWGAKRTWQGPTLFAECGWLPRWHYQLSHTGINAKHHLAPLTIETLDAEQRWKVDVHLDRIRSGIGAPPWGYLDIAAPPAESVPGEFVLAPLQMENDTNMDSVPEPMRANQGFVDFVTGWVEAQYPDTRIVFKQHPNSAARSQLGLKMRRKGDKVCPHKQSHVYGYLKHPGCRVVVTANSNTANDALLYDVPVNAFGKGIWPDDAFDPQNRKAYTYALMRAQWRIHECCNPRRVAEAIEGAMEPHERKD